jgi:aspartyl-tRNA(Asn)/glutamyl-tRNA(Gln) amidotransferase subunit B
MYGSYEAVIGSEIHVQLHTDEKIFCFCKNRPSAQPNENICEICVGYPGTLPLFNRDVLISAIKAGLATNCQIRKENEFARKHYFYADLPKGYQITQSDFPICEEGFVEIEKADGSTKKIRIKRIHMEEDAGKNLHTDSYGSLVDLNRAGTPLLEIVSYPDMESSEEVVLYLKVIHGIMVSLGITTGNMEDGAFRSDTNISVRLKGVKELGTKCELKNINSFKFIKDATEYEIKRQIELIESGEKIVQQTRLWDTKLKTTYAMRDKETAADYRYLPDPDLTKIKIDDAEIALIQSTLPELPHQKKARFILEYGLNRDDAAIIIDDQRFASYFEKVYRIIPSKLVTTWFLRELLKAYKDHPELSVDSHTFTAEKFADLIVLLEEKKITQKIAQDIFAGVFLTGESPSDYAQKHSLLGEMMTIQKIREIVKEVLSQEKTAVIELRSGKERARGFLIGKIMAQTKGKADPKEVNRIFGEEIAI